MIAAWEDRQRRYRSIDRLTWGVALAILLLLVTLTIGLGRLHLGYLLCSLLAALTRALPLTLDAWWCVPSFLHEPRFQGPALRAARAEAHEALREGYLEALLVAAGRWRNEEKRAAMSLEDVEAVVATLDLPLRRRLPRLAAGAWVVAALVFVVTLTWLEVAYRRGELLVEGGLLR